MKDSLQTTLRKLRLSGLAQTLDVRLQEAARPQPLSHVEFLELILQDELLVRDERQINRRVKAAAFRELKPLDQFDWSFNPRSAEETGLRPGHLPFRPRAPRRADDGPARNRQELYRASRRLSGDQAGLHRAVSLDLRCGPRLPARRGARRRRQSARAISEARLVDRR